MNQHLLGLIRLVFVNFAYTEPQLNSFVDEDGGGTPYYRQPESAPGS